MHVLNVRNERIQVMRTSTSSEAPLPPSFSKVARLDPDFAYVIAKEYDALHAFALKICARFGLEQADAEDLCEMATVRGTMDRRLGLPIREEVVRVWKSSLLNLIAAELEGIEPVFEDD